MAIRGTNIFALLRDSDDEEKPKPAPAPVVSVKQSKPAQVSAAPQKKQEPAVADEAPVDLPQKEAKRGEKRAEKPVLDDRHSKTGRGKELKKDGQGAHNWGGQGSGKQERLEEPVETAWDAPEKEAEEPAEAPVVASEDVPVASEPKRAVAEVKKPEEPDFIRLRREEEEKARKEAESYRTYKEFLGAETEGDKPKSNSLLGFRGQEGQRGGRGRGRGRGKVESEGKPRVPDLSDQLSFPKLG